MEKFRTNIIRGGIQIIFSLVTINFIGQLLPYFEGKFPNIKIVIVFNSVALLYMVLTKYVISLTINSLRKEVIVTQFWVFRKTKYIIPFKKLRYSYTIANIGKGYRGKTLRLHFDENIIKLPINQFGWNGKSLDGIVHSLEKNKITKLKLDISGKDASAEE